MRFKPLTPLVTAKDFTQATNTDLMLSQHIQIE
jgi:hypothetical protein